MEILEQQVRRAQRRLILEQFVGIIDWCWFVALVVAAVAIGIGKIWNVGVEAVLWNAAWIGGTLAAGTLVAIVWTLVKRRSRLEAAIEIDRRFELKERVSSALALSDEERESQLGAALMHDAMRRIDRVYVGEHFAVKPDRRALLPLLPAIAAFAIALFVDGPGQQSTASATPSASSTQQIRKSAKSLQKPTTDLRKKAEEKQLKEAEGLLRKLELEAKNLASKEKVDQKQALVKLNDLAKELEKRREKLVSNDRMRQQLNHLKDLQKGPADKVAEALKEGDLGKAVQELKKLSDKIAKGELDAKQKDELVKQLKQAQDKLQKMVDAHKQAKQQLQNEIAKREKAGDKAGASKMQQKLDKLTQQSPQMDQMSKMAQQMAQAAKGLKQGKSSDASAALSEMAKDLAAAQESLEEMEMLDSALAQIEGAKGSMSCKECGGDGCAACNGGMGRQQGIGDGLGPGQGKGARPEAKTNTSTYDSAVRQNVGRGGAVITDLVGGLNRKGNVEEEIKAEFESAKRLAADPLTGQKLPREYRDHAKKYFESLREGRD